MGEAPCWRRTGLWGEGRLLAGGQTCGVRGGSLLEDRPVGWGRLLAGGGQACGVREAPCWRRTGLWCEGRLLAAGGQTCGVRGGSLLEEDRPVV